jgi:branched-chain amino acid transport system ATP-binding protein
VKTTGLHVGDAVPGVKKHDPILIADGVKRTFGGLTAVDVEHVEIPRGAITALIGPNGAGKTTFFNLLTGFDKPDTGTWSFDGRSLAHVPAYRSRAWDSSAPSSSPNPSHCSRSWRT